jgi:hypothetical protein
LHMRSYGQTSSRDRTLGLYWRFFGKLILEFWFIQTELFWKYRPFVVEREFYFPNSEWICSWKSTSPPSVSRLYRNCRCLDVSEPCWPPRPVTGTAFPFFAFNVSSVCSVVSTQPICV